MPLNLCRQLQIAVLAAGAVMPASLHPACLAQDPETKTVDSAIASRDGLTIDLDFQGGTAADYIKALRSAAKGKINIVAMPHVEEVSVPPVTLRNVDLLAAVRLLDGETLQSGNRQVRLVMQPLTPTAGPGTILVKINAVVKEAGVISGPERSNIWSVADLVGGDMSPEQITTAVSAALELLGPDSPKAQVRFHKETSLLLARAEVEQIQIIENVIDQLRRSSAHRREQSIKPLHEEIAALRERAEAAQNDRTAVEMEAVERLRLAETAKVRAEAMERRSVEMEDTVARLRNELMQRESIIRALEEELSKLREQAKRQPNGE